MPILTVIDHEVLADIAHLGNGLIMITRSAGADEPHCSTPTGHTISLYRVYRLIAAGKLAPSYDGLFPGFTQTYRIV